MPMPKHSSSAGALRRATSVNGPPSSGEIDGVELELLCRREPTWALQGLDGVVLARPGTWTPGLNGSLSGFIASGCKQFPALPASDATAS